jgi:hypothetical protein
MLVLDAIRDGKFTALANLFARVPFRARVLEAMILAGAFDFFVRISATLFVRVVSWLRNDPHFPQLAQLSLKTLVRINAICEASLANFDAA